MHPHPSVVSSSLCAKRSRIGEGGLLSLFLLLGAVCFGADKSGVSPSAISLPKGPGSIEGLGESFQPRLNSGTAAYGIGLSLPPGTAGHAPSLKLSYEGGGGNGVLGFGWSLPLPMIQRRSDKGIPLYGEDLGLDRPDRFINESKEELVPQADGYFFCENEGSFIRYRPVDDHWEATLPDGTRLSFGLTASGRVSDPATGHVFGWLLEKESDTHGNTIVYAYRSFEGEANRNHKFLASVTYGPGAPPFSSFHFVAFDYEDRPDWFEDCRSGFVVRCGKRMRRIVIGTQGADAPGHLVGDWNGDGKPDVLNRQYELDYLNYAGANTHWSLLAKVQMVGSDGVSRLPATTLGYGVCNPPDTLSAAGLAFGGLNEPPAVMDNEFVELADLNGDGLPDLLRTFDGGLPHQAFLNQGFNPSSRALGWKAAREIPGDARAWNVNLQSAKGVAHLADMDGDGLADLVVKSAINDVFFFSNRGDLGWGDRQGMSAGDVAPPSPFGTPGVRTADLDFDKRIDVIQSLNLGGGVAYRMWFNLGEERYSSSVTVEDADGFNLTDPAVQMVDFNGDRVADLVWIRPERLLVKAGLGYGRFASVIAVDLPGLTLSPNQLKLAKLSDVTGDGMADLVLERAGPGELCYWINRGNYELGSRKSIVGMPLVTGQGAVVRWADMNGNGTPDLVYADGSAEPRMQTIDVGDIIHCGANPNILNSIANGLGRTTRITYRSSIQFRLEDEAQGNPWPNKVPFPLQVVSAVTSDDSLGHAYRTEYRYHDGYYDPKQKQFRGFARVEQVEVGDPTAPTLVSRSYFDTGSVHEPMKGKLLRQMAEDEQGRVFWDESTTWTVPPLVLRTGTNGQSVTFVHPKGHSKVIQERGEGIERRIETEFRYDAFGNKTFSADYGIVEDGDRSAFNDERITTTEFALNLDAWILRLAKRSEVKSLDGKVISRAETFYDDETFSGNNFGQVFKGNVTLDREWIDPSKPDAYVKSSRAQYDAYGNPRVLLDPLADAPGGTVDFSKGHAREVAYDPHLRNHAVTETIYVGGGKPPFVFRADYDEAFGIVVASTDFNTNKTSYAYDAFARVTAIVKPGDAPEFPTSEYRYALAVPFGAEGLVNYTETRLLDQVPRSRAAKLDHYMISREFTDGMGRELMSKKEAEPYRADSSPAVIVNGAVTFNARRSISLDLNPFFSLAGESLEALLDYESIEDPGWEGLFQDPGALVSLNLEQAHKTATWYDPTLREIRSINPDGSFERTVHEPLLTRSYDANQTDPGSPHLGAAMARSQDGLGRLIRVDEIVRLMDDGTPSGTTTTWATRYEHDLNDLLIRITDSQQNVKAMAYDGLMRNVFMNDPDRGLMRFVYDDASNLIETTDAKAQRITYTFDGANRVLSEDYHDNNPRLSAFNPSQPITPANRPDVAFFYDTPVTSLDVGDGTTMTARNTVGLLTYVWDLTGEEHYFYDNREHATALVKRVIDPLHGQLVSFRTGFEFDSLNRLKSVRYPDNDLVRYEFNERGLGNRVIGGPTGSLLSNVLYSPAGQITFLAYGNGVETSSSYDSRLRLEQVRTRHPQLGLEHVGLSYDFDSASKLRSITDFRPSSSIADGSPRRNTQLMNYDDLYRLTDVRYSFAVPGAPSRNDGEIRYRYDRIGNMLSQTSNIPHFDKGLSVTDLGAMDYGGSAGRQGRNGRLASDSPGPHALTAARHSPLSTRQFPYDANGNMLEIDGLKTTWDFKDRLVAVETQELRAEYGYDHRDRRITKKVIAKGPASTVAGQTDSTIYVDQHFEVRNNGVPTKYVWSGTMRIARVTGTISSNQRVQRLRLWRGWNLCSLGVTADSAGKQLAAGGSVGAILRWDAVKRDFREVAPTEAIAAGTVLWIDAITNATVIVRGLYAGDTWLSHAPAGGTFHPGGFPESLDLEKLAPGNTAIWRFDAATQRWQARLSDVLSGLSNLPEALAPGESVFVQAENEAALSLPDEALTIRYYHQDHLGSSAVIADANGVAVEETTFYPFGFPRHAQKFLKTTDPYQFAQKERDGESGLNFLEARFQSPLLGRFLRVDPLAGSLKSSWLAEPQRLNLYAYCANSPLGHIDPTGTDLLQAYKGFGMGLGDVGLGIVNPLNVVLMPAAALVSTAKEVYTTVGKLPAVATAIQNGNVKEALNIAYGDKAIVKMFDPKTSDQQMGRIIGNATGQLLVLIAGSKVAAGAGPKGPAAPAAPAAAPKTVVGSPMSPGAQVAKTQPAMATKTLRDPTLRTGPAGDYGLRQLTYKTAGGKAQRLAWELENKMKQKMYGEEFQRQVAEKRPEMDKMIEKTGSAKPILKGIAESVEQLYGNWD